MNARLLTLACAMLCSAAAAAAQAQQPAADPRTVLPAQPDETHLLPALKSIVIAASPAQLKGPAAVGIELRGPALLDHEEFRGALAIFVDQPVSMASIDRLQQMVRFQLRLQGQPFALVYAPQQDISDGTLRIVVQLARLEGEPAIQGAGWSSAPALRQALHIAPGGEIDLPVLEADIAWLNRNPFRHVAPVLEAGSSAGSTRLALQVDESTPWALSASADNSGTAVTGEGRLGAGLQWGNALGRGDLLSYRYNTDPSFDHLHGHTLGYTAFLPWRHLLSLQGAWSRIKSDVPEPFAQRGKSWQLGARYEIPLAAPRAGWTHSVSLSADFKASDNNLEFSAIPVTANLTHVAQLGASYSASGAALGGQHALSLSVFASPGGLDAHNADSAFDGSRAGAKARYAYAKFSWQLQQPLSGGLSWQAAANLQLSSGALLGSEQLAGAGNAAVRGYRENSAFGDWGVVLSNELHLPAFEFDGNRAALFAFADIASLRLRVTQESTDLHSLGLGLNWSLGRQAQLRAAYGWHPRNAVSPNETGRGHLALNMQW